MLFNVFLFFSFLVSQQEVFANNSFESELLVNLIHNTQSKQDCEDMCPDFLSQWVEEDYSPGLVGYIANKSPISICRGYLPKKNNFTANDFLQGLHKNVNNHLGDFSTPFIAKCIQSDRYSERQKRSLVTKHAYAMKKIDAGAQSIVKEIAALNSVLATPLKIESQLSCGGGLLPNANSMCLEAEKCKYKKSNFDNLLTTAKKASTEYDQIKAAHKKASRKLFLKKNSIIPLKAKDLDVLKKNESMLRDSLKYYEGVYPWLSGNEFKKNKSKGVEVALNAQLDHNRKSLIKKYEDLRYHAACVNGLNSSSNKCSFDKTLKVLGELPSVNLTTSNKNKLLAKDTNNYLEHARCLEDNINFRDKTDKILYHAGANAVLMALTAGVPALAARGVIASGAAAKTTMIAVDLAWFAPSTHEAIKTCTSKKQKLLKSTLEEDSNNTCPTYNNSSLNGMVEFDDCVTATMFAAMDGLPILPAFIKTSINPIKPIKKSQAKSSKNSTVLKPVQNPINTNAQAQLVVENKVRALSNGKITEKQKIEIEKIVRSYSRSNQGSMLQLQNSVDYQYQKLKNLGLNDTEVKVLFDKNVLGVNLRGSSVEGKVVAVTSPSGKRVYVPKEYKDKITFVKPSIIRYSQDTANFITGDGRTLKQLEHTNNVLGWLNSPIDVVKIPRTRTVVTTAGTTEVVNLPTGLVSMDNRRLIAANEAGITEVPVVLLEFDDPIPLSYGKTLDETIDEKKYTVRKKRGKNIILRENGELSIGGDNGRILYPRGYRAINAGEALLFRTIRQNNIPMGGSFSKPTIINNQ